MNFKERYISEKEMKYKASFIRKSGSITIHDTNRDRITNDIINISRVLGHGKWVVYNQDNTPCLIGIIK